MLALSGWPLYARVARSAAVAERGKEYVRGLRVLGAGDWRILLLFAAPNILPPIAFVAVLDVARMMIFEAILGFLGLGIQPPTPSFGSIIADSRKYLINAWWIATMPGHVPRGRADVDQSDGIGAREGAQPDLRRSLRWISRSFSKSDDLTVGPVTPGSAPILDRISLRLNTSEIFGIYGESGAGKTVLSRALANWLPESLAISRRPGRLRRPRHSQAPESGDVRTGRDIAYIGSKPQSSLDPTMPVGSQIAEKLHSVRPEWNPARMPRTGHAAARARSAFPRPRSATGIIRRNFPAA